MVLSDYSMVSFDVDQTIFRIAALHYAASGLGIRENWDVIDESYERSRITLKERLETHYKLLEGFLLQDILREVANVEVIKNVGETIERLERLGIRVILLTDLPDFLCVYLVERFGFNDYVASRVDVEDGVVRGVVEPLADKGLGLKKYCESLSIPLSKCIHVGDGVNDVPVFRIAGYSVALNAEDNNVRASASHEMRTDDLLDVYRYLQSDSGP